MLVRLKPQNVCPPRAWTKSTESLRDLTPAAAAADDDEDEDDEDDDDDDDDDDV